MSKLREKYFNTLGFNEHNELKRGKALDRAYQLRSFEIEHYWKRATYFWAFQAAIFAAIFAALAAAFDPTKPNAAANWGLITVALSVLGVLTAVANYLSARGSKFWHENWEKHIEMLEDEIEGRLYKTVWLPKEKASKGKTSFSVSRVNLLLSSYFIIFWIFVTVFVTLKSVSPDFLRSMPAWPWWAIIIVVFAVLASTAILLVCGKSRLPGSLPNDDGSHSPPFGSKVGDKDQTFIRRYAPDEDC